MQKFSLQFFLPFIVFILAACGDLAGDVEIVATLPPATSLVEQQEFQLPENAPDIANGQRIFAANCTRCHGTSGAGNGELVELGEVPRMPSFLEPAHVRQQSLEFYYDIITNGNIVNLMPPWGNSLSLQERWDVLAYVYSLNYSPEQIERGASLLPNADTTIQAQSDSSLAAETGLEGEDAFAAVAYQRVQSFQNWNAETSAPLPEATEIPLPTFETISFLGTITHGTADKTIPPALTVQLRYGNETTGLQLLETSLDSNNQFRFENVPFDISFQYFAVANYQGRGFVSELVGGELMQATNELSIVFYDTIADPNLITLSQIDFRIDNLNVISMGEGLSITQINTYENPTDRMFVLQPEGQDISVSLLMQLPVGANILNDPNDPRFIYAQEDYALIDLQPVYPGRHEIQALYFIPYENGRLIDIPLNNRLEGLVNILVAVPEISIRSDSISLLDEEINLGTAENPQMAKIYSGTLNLAVGESLIFDIDGQLPNAINMEETSNVVTQDQLLPILLLMGIIVIGLLVGVGVGLRLRSRARNPQSQINAIMNEISQLENLHEAGRINHDAFQQQRQALKKKLADLMAEQKQNG